MTSKLDEAREAQLAARRTLDGCIRLAQDALKTEGE